MSIAIENLSPMDQERFSSILMIFNMMRWDGIDMHQPLLYSYFFYDVDQKKLERLKEVLIKEKYQVVRSEKSGADDDRFVLQVEKVETHTVESFFEREKYFSNLAKQSGVECYDGWEAGNSDETKPLINKVSFEESLKEKTEKEVYDIGIDLRDREIFNLAISAFEECVGRNYSLEDVYLKLGVCYMETYRYEEAVSYFEKVLVLNPDSFKAYFNLAATWYYREDFEKTIAYYQKACNLDPNDDAVYYGIAAAEYALGNLAEAEIYCKKALELNPDNEIAKRCWEILKEKS